MSRLTFSMAGPEDDEALKRRMAEDWMDGPVAVSFRREPHFFLANAVFGEESQVVKCTDTKRQTLVGLGSRSTFHAWINGRIQRHGYLSDLRVHPDYRGGTVLARGYRYLSKIHDRDPVAYYDSLILDGNEAARVLLESDRPALPRYTNRGRISSPAIPLAMPKQRFDRSSLKVWRGSDAELGRIMAFHHREASRKQFYPVWQARDFGTPRLRGLKVTDLYIAVSGNEIVGLVAAWDQHAFRQSYVERYQNWLRMARPFINAASRVSPAKPLPKPGNPLPYFYISMVTIKDNDPDIFAYLLREVYRDRRSGDWHYMIPCLHERDPLIEAFRDYWRIDAGGFLYTVQFPQAPARAEPLDDRIPYVELAAK